jgi:hypothetical protein
VFLVPPLFVVVERLVAKRGAPVKAEARAQPDPHPAE